MDEFKQETNRSITSIENFSNELFYEICDYLDGYDLYNAFSNLNSHFQQLLNSPFLSFKIIYSDSKPTDIFLNTWNQIHTFHREQIFSIDFYISSDIDQFYLSSFLIDSSLNHLQSLVIHDLKTDILMSILTKLSYLPCLFALTINMAYDVTNLTEIYQLIFNLPVLKSYKFVTYDENLTVTLSIADNKLSPIEYLIIDHCCTLNELSIITSYTPQLRHLKFTHDFKGDVMNRNISSMILPNLTYLSLHDFDSTFDTFKIFISKLDANIKFLRIITQSQDLTYFDAYQWEKLLLKYLPQLEKFHLEYREYIHQDPIFPTYVGQLNQFTSSFWLEKQWLFDTTIEYDYIKYSVRPYKKRWYEYPEDHPINLKSNLLNIEDTPSMDSSEPLFKCIKRCLEIAQIYHLEISLSKTTLILLIRILSLLPELHSLKLHSLSYTELNESDKEELFSFLSTCNTNKITKIYVEKLLLMSEIFFLMGLFPYMTHLKLDCVYNVEVQSCLRDILIEINNKSSNHLRSLCFGVAMADNEIINILHQMIDDEQLLINYTIKRLVNKIYVEWK